MISTLRGAVLTVLWIGFCHTEPRFTVRRFTCVYLCVFRVFLFHIAYVFCYCEHGGVDLMGLKPNPLDQTSFSVLTLLVESFDP